MPKISKRIVDGLKSPLKRSWIWDSELKGFGIALRPTGTHSYVFSYRDRYGSQRSITIGKVGGLTPEAARRKAEEHRRAVVDGVDPLALKQADRTALTVGDLLDRYLESDTFNRKAPSTQTVDRGRIAAHLRPTLGSVKLPALSAGDIARAHKKIAAGDTATVRPSGKARGRIRVKGGEGTARMAVRLLRAILSWGRKEKIVPPDLPTDLTSGIDIGRDGRRDLILDEPAAYARLWQALDRLTDPSSLEPGDRLMRPEVADAIRVIALTGARRGEITGLRWAYVNIKAGMLVLPVDAHKTGRKTQRERIIGLPSLASAIISRQPAGEPNDLVFRPTRGGDRIDLTRPWRTVRKAAGLPGGIGLHGLRHSLASHMAMSGAEAAEIMAALGHRDITTSARYVHWARQAHQRLAEKAAAGITAAITRVTTANPAGNDEPL